MFTNTTIKVVVLTLMLVLASSTAMAAGQSWCYGTVVDLFMYKNGELYVRPSWRNDWIRVCNINQDLDGVTPQNCATWFALLRNAVTNKENTIISYLNAPACADIPTYGSAPVPLYVMLRD